MLKYLLALALLMSCALSISALGLNLDEEDEDRDLDDNERALFVISAANGNFFGLNLSQLIPLLALAAAALLPILCCCALATVLLSQLLNQKSSGGGYGNSYSEYSRALGLDSLNWEQISLLDWLSIGEETYRKFEPSNFNCQKRVICEIHQNVKEFGTLAKIVVQIFGYLPYAQVLSLPEVLESTISEYSEAADAGRSLKKDCGDIFPDCEFSLKALYKKFSINSL